MKQEDRTGGRAILSPACENNKSFILEVLRRKFATRTQVLEIGSGTGQHACHFAEHMPWLLWQPSDLQENLPPLRRRLARYAGVNLLPAVPFDARQALAAAASRRTLHRK
ncbi:MAG: DUF938 domain-containing protein [Halioglobus sp.]